MQEVLAVDIPEAARRLGLSTRMVACLVARHEIASRKVGRRRIIPVVALEAFVRKTPTTSDREQNNRCHSRGLFEGK
jgi:excisionase family DNA binding protein